MLKINVLTEFPSPHMMDFWEAVHKNEDVQLRLFFEKETLPRKPWGRIAGYLNAEVANWSELSINDKIRWLKRISSVLADVWVLCDNYWFWENHLLAFWMRQKNIPTIYLAERIYWESYKLIDHKPASGVGVLTNSWINIVYRILKKAIIPFVVRSFDALACFGTWSVEQYKSFASSRYIFPTEYYVNLDDLRRIERLMKKSNDFVNLGFCGSLIPGKGLRYILHNLNLISSFSNWRLIIAGDGPLRNELESAVPVELKPKVEFLGHVPAHKMKDFWGSIDILLFPSLYDGWGMVVLEAMVAGAPVISGLDVGAARQYIKNGYNGKIQNVDNSFLQAVVPILEDPRKLNELSVNARSWVEKYRPEIGAQNFINHLKILTNQG